jgi:hypothetical protein
MLRLMTISHPYVHLGKLRLEEVRFFSPKPHNSVRQILKNKKQSQALVPQACNPSHSEGRDQEDHSSKPAWASSQ